MTFNTAAQSPGKQLTGKTDGGAEREAPRLVQYEERDLAIRTADTVRLPPGLHRKIVTSWHPPVTVSDPMDIYPGLAEASSALQSAVRLLDQCAVLIDEAVTSQTEGNVIVADDAMQRLRALLPELFCCRTLGDGFGAAVNAVHYSLANRHGQPLDLLQVRAVGGALRLIRMKPFLTLDEAVPAIDSMDESGLVAGPSEMGSLADITNGEGVY